MTDEQGRVLVVDDNEMNRDMLSRRLQRQEYAVIVAENGVQALELMRSNNFDLVLLDIMMPQMNGYEVLERVKHDTQLRDVPIIMISAVDELESVVKCIELGAEDYLFKPFNPVLLKARVSASLEKKRLRDQQQGDASTEKREFLVKLARELKPPIASILVDVDRLLSGAVGPITSQQEEHLRRIVGELDRVTRLVNEFGAPT